MSTTQVVPRFRARQRASDSFDSATHSRTPRRRRTAPLLATAAVIVGTILGPASGVAAAANGDSAADATPVTKFSFKSAAGDYIGGGRTDSYVDGGSVTVTVTGSSTHIDLSVDDSESGSWWHGSLSAGLGDTLHPGVYRHAERDPFRTGRSPGIDISGEGRGCNQIWGSFTIDQIAYDADSTITMLDLSFVQHCESKKAPPLKGKIWLSRLPLTYHMASAAGDYVGGGVTRTYTGHTSTLTVNGDATALTAGVSGKRDYWTMLIAAPTGQQLEVGKTYETARFRDADHAGLDVFGNGRGCNQSAGTLTVKGLAFAEGGVALAGIYVTFTQYCDGSPAPLKGKLRILA